MHWQKENKLDYLLQECRDELSRHKTDDEWEDIAKKICDDPSAKRDKPLFIMYLNKLESDGLIKKNERGHVATFEGLFYKGYKRMRRREINATNLQVIQTWAIAIGTILAGLYALYQFLAHH
jgi:hypothetical protein